MISTRAYLRLRRFVVGRQLREIGVWRWALLGPLALVLAGRALSVAAASAGGIWAVPVLLALLLSQVHRQRADLRFLANTGPDFRGWLAIEYALGAAPIALALFGLGLTIGRVPAPAVAGAALLTVGLAALVAWVPARGEAPRRSRRRSPFRSEAFEWVGGARASGALWLAPVLLAAAAWPPRSPLGPVLGLAVWLLVCLGHYGTPEPATMLLLAGQAPGTFLRRRLALGLWAAAAVAGPLLLVLATTAAGPAGALAVGLAWAGLLSLVILAKYAFYPSVWQIRSTQALLLGVALGLPGHPLYPVLLLVAVGGLLWQSRRRLTELLG